MFRKKIFSHENCHFDSLNWQYNTKATKIMLSRVAASGIILAEKHNGHFWQNVLELSGPYSLTL